VREILLRLAREHPLIVDSPEPIVTFESFGDSSLNFTMRVFLSSMDHRLSVIHDLHTAIHNALDEAGISIPFPQRDLHLRSAESPLAVDLRRRPPGGAAGDFSI
jgi:potassium efflux system protein